MFKLHTPHVTSQIDPHKNPRVNPANPPFLIMARGTISWTDITFDKDEDDEKIELGRGSFGTVFSAVFRHQRVAVKQFGTGAPLSAAALAAVQREAELQSRLAHDNVVRVYGLAVENRPGVRPKYALVLAVLHESLSSLLTRVASGDCGPPSEALSLDWRLNALHDLASGLAHLHVHRITHGDMKPQNIMLTSPRTGCVLQITDFGLAREGGTTLGSAAAAGGRTATGAGGVGTVGYMAPELTAAPVPGAPPPRPGYRTDVFAWTVAAWQLLAASPSPYPGFNDMQVASTVAGGGRPDLAALPGGLPASIPALLASGWAAAPRDRPRSGCELLEALREAAPPAEMPPPLPPALAPGGGAAAAAAADGAAAVVGLGRAPEITEWRPGPVLAECSVCGRENLAGVGLGCAAGHELCMGCALRVIRDELTQEATMVRCPFCPRTPGAEVPMSEAAVLEVAAWSRRVDLRGAAEATGALRPLGPGELVRFYRLESDRRERADAAARRAAEAAAPLPEGLFKRCPGRRPDGSPCGEGIQHARGHACHHIKPGTGCPTCRTHFCYACLGPYPCRNGCRMFCTPNAHEPTAAACDCSDCVDCAPGRPCSECDNDGRCFVCQPELRPSTLPLPRAVARLVTGGGGGGGSAPAPRSPARPARLQPVLEERGPAEARAAAAEARAAAAEAAAEAAVTALQRERREQQQREQQQREQQQREQRAAAEARAADARAAAAAEAAEAAAEARQREQARLQQERREQQQREQQQRGQQQPEQARLQQERREQQQRAAAEASAKPKHRCGHEYCGVKL